MFTGVARLDFDGMFRLEDNITNEHFGPKIQDVVENMIMVSGCPYKHIQEDHKKGTTKYICDNDHASLNFSRTFDNARYDYRVQNMTFELPSKRLIIQAEED